MFKLIETNDFNGLTEIFHNNGLEIAIGAAPPEGLIKCWEIIEAESGRRVGGMALEKRAGEFVLGDMAVEKEYRRKKLGAQMLEKVIEEVKSLGGKRIMLTAKVPGFYIAKGFISIDRENAPAISKCMSCEQYNVDCFPKVMYFDID